MQLSRTQLTLRRDTRHRRDELEVYFREPETFRYAVFVPRDTWDLMGRPEQLTMTLEPSEEDTDG